MSAGFPTSTYSRPDGDADADFKFLARDTSHTDVDNCPLLVASKRELREYKAVSVVSDEITINCTPLVWRARPYGWTSSRS